MFRDMGGAHGEVPLARRRLGIPVFSLVVRVGTHQRGVEGQTQLGQFWGQRRDTVRSGDEHIGQAFVPMHVQAEIDTGVPHAVAHQIDFRAFFHSRVSPFTVQISARSVHAQISPAAAIRIHVRHDIQCGGVQHGPRHRVCRVQHAIHEAFHPIRCLGFTGVLAPDDPAFALDGIPGAPRIMPNDQHVQIFTIQGLAETLQPHPVG